MYRTTTERLSALLINSVSLAVVRGGMELVAKGLLKGDDLLSPQGEVSFIWPTWPPEVLEAAGELMLLMEQHIASCLSGQTRAVPPPGLVVPPRLAAEGPGPSSDVPELSPDDDIAGSFNLPESEQPKQF